jgi:hypothetical protein
LRLAVLPEAQKQRRLGGLKDIILDIRSDFDAPLEDFTEYME